MRLLEDEPDGQPLGRDPLPAARNRDLTSDMQRRQHKTEMAACISPRSGAHTQMFGHRETRTPGDDIPSTHAAMGASRALQAAARKATPSRCHQQREPKRHSNHYIRPSEPACKKRTGPGAHSMDNTVDAKRTCHRADILAPPPPLDGGAETQHAASASSD